MWFLVCSIVLGSFVLGYVVVGVSYCGGVYLYFLCFFVFGIVLGVI